MVDVEVPAETKPTVRDINSSRGVNGSRDGSELRTVTAKLSVTGPSLIRLLSVSGFQSDFVLASADGATTVKVGLAVSSVPDAELELGSEGVVLDWSRSTLTRGSNRVSLTRMELRLLVALLEYAPKAAPREHLIRRLWPSHSERVHERDEALPVWICTLRRRFAAIGLAHAIRTVRSAGYSLSL